MTYRLFYELLLLIVGIVVACRLIILPMWRLIARSPATPDDLSARQTAAETLAASRRARDDAQILLDAACTDGEAETLHQARERFIKQTRTEKSK